MLVVVLENQPDLFLQSDSTERNWFHRVSLRSRNLNAPRTSTTYGFQISEFGLRILGKRGGDRSVPDNFHIFFVTLVTLV